MKYSTFSTQRVGSTLVLNILWCYLSRKMNYIGNLNEFQNPKWVHSDSEDQIKTTFIKTDNKTTTIQQIETINHNIKLLRKYHHQNYMIKFMAFAPITENQLLWDYVLSNYHLIMVERKNKKEQLLSLIIGKETGKWIEYNNTVVYPPTVIFKEKIGYLFIDRLKQYERIKKDILSRKEKKSWIIYYEDLIQLENPFQLLESFGFTDWEEYIKEQDFKKLPKKQNPFDKSQFISNIDEFNKWFKSAGIE